MCSLSEIECLLLHFGIDLCVDSNSGKAHHILTVEEIYANKDVFHHNDPNFTKVIYPLLICSVFLKYPFGHLFQTEIKIDFKTN